MAVDYFLKIDGIPGESKDSHHPDELELESFGWGETQAISHAAGGGVGAGKVEVHDLHFLAQMSKASPKLMLACAAGQHIKQAVLTARKAGGGQQEFLVIKLSDVLVTDYHTGGAAQSDTVPLDEVSFTFAKIEVEYRLQKPDGTLDAPVKAGWDVKGNKPA